MAQKQPTGHQHQQDTGKAGFGGLSEQLPFLLLCAAVCCRWKGDDAGHFSRTFEFTQPKKGLASSPAQCVQAQRFSVHASGVFVMTTDMAMTGIPYADSFRVQSFWKVGQGGVQQRLCGGDGGVMQTRQCMQHLGRGATG